MPPNLVTGLLANVRALMASHAGLFQTEGLAIYASVTIIALSVFGWKWMGSPAEPDWHAFTVLLFQIALVGTMLSFYTMPNPLFAGSSFGTLIPNIGMHYAAQVEAGLGDQIIKKLTSVTFSLENPVFSAIKIAGNIAVVSLVTPLLVALGAVIMVLSFAPMYITAVAVVVGPLFISFMIVPSLEFLFWGWLRFILTASFIPLFANVFLLVIGQMLLSYFDNFMSYSLNEMAGHILLLPIVVGTAILTSLVVPLCSYYVFSGVSSISTPGVVSSIRGWMR